MRLKSTHIWSPTTHNGPSIVSSFNPSSSLELSHLPLTFRIATLIVLKLSRLFVIHHRYQTVIQVSRHATTTSKFDFPSSISEVSQKYCICHLFAVMLGASALFLTGLPAEYLGARSSGHETSGASFSCEF